MPRVSYSYGKYYEGDKTVEKVSGFLALALVLIAAIVTPWYVYGTSRTETLAVTRLDDQSTQHSHQYLVFTKQGVYKDVDSLLKFKFNSSDLFGRLQAGKTYNCSVYGWRVGFFSTYPNLVSCTAVQ